MKNSIHLLIFLFIFILPPIILESYFSIYLINDFTSKGKLYQDFNNSVKDKSINVKFINDSSIAINNGIVIENGTLYSIWYPSDKNYKRIDLSEIKKLNYTRSDSKSANLLLKNNYQINAGDINIANNTIECSITKKILMRIEAAPFYKIKETSYKNHRLGITGWFLAWTGLWILVGAIIFVSRNNGSPDNACMSLNSFLTIPFGSFVGIIWGWMAITILINLIQRDNFRIDGVLWKRCHLFQTILNWI